MKYPVIILFFLSLFITVFTSCHQKGCTDKDAVNFNVTADEDDGSCIVCHTIETELDSEKVYLKDKKFGSPHYNQQVARFSLYQVLLTPDDKACGKENCKIMLEIQSLINQKMYFYYGVNTYSGPVYINYDNDITLDSNEFVHVGVIEQLNNPPFLRLSLDSLSVGASNIIYF